MCVDGDLAFVHRLEQRGLRLGRGAIDFVCQQNVGENRAALEFEFLFQRRIHRNAKNVGWKHVAGELHALKRAIDGAGKSLSERGLANARNTLNQQMASRENADQGKANDLVFAANHTAKSFFEFGGFVRNSDSGLGRHCLDSTIGHGESGVTYVTGPAISIQASVLSETQIPRFARDESFIFRTQSLAMLAAAFADSLLHKLRRPSGEPLDALRNGRMRREQTAEVHSEERLNDE